MDESKILAYGRCPLGHNIRPSGDTGDNLSTTQIPEGEWRPLYWSVYYQDFVCLMHYRLIDSEITDDQKHKDFRDLDKKVQGMGFTR